LETTVKDDEISRLKERVKHLEKDLAERERALGAAQAESGRLAKEIAAAEARLSQASSEHDAKMKESRVQAEIKLQELGKTLASSHIAAHRLSCSCQRNVWRRRRRR
jgi:chromosome segregation ATPase